MSPAWGSFSGNVHSRSLHYFFGVCTWGHFEVRSQLIVLSLHEADMPFAAWAGLAPGAWSIMGRRGSAGSSRGDLAALWGPQQELAMQGSWESLAALLGNPLPLPLDAIPFPEMPPPPNSSGSSMDPHLPVRASQSLPHAR